MAKTDFRTVDEYLATLPVEVRKVLGRARTVIKKALPGAEEVISYQIPAYKLSGRAVLYLAGWKEHLSLYPITPALSQALGKELAPHVAGRGTLRFSLSESLPVHLIARIAKLRGQETLARVASKAKPARKKAPRKKAAARPIAARATKVEASLQRAPLKKASGKKKASKKRRRALTA